MTHISLKKTRPFIGIFFKGSQFCYLIYILPIFISQCRNYLTLKKEKKFITIMTMFDKKKNMTLVFYSLTFLFRKRSQVFLFDICFTDGYYIFFFKKMSKKMQPSTVYIFFKKEKIKIVKTHVGIRQNRTNLSVSVPFRLHPPDPSFLATHPVSLSKDLAASATSPPPLFPPLSVPLRLCQSRLFSFHVLSFFFLRKR